MTSLCDGDSDINRLKTFVGESPSSSVYNIASLKEVHYFGISGGRISNREHFQRIKAVIQHIEPCHVNVLIGGNELESADLVFDVNSSIFQLVAFLTQIQNSYHVCSVTVLSLFHRVYTRHVIEQFFN